MPLLTDIELEIADAKIAKDLPKLAKKDLFGYKTKANWNDVYCRHFILDMFNCTGGAGLDQCDIDCLKGKLTMGLKNNCC